jgi:hypothetical protein
LRSVIVCREVWRNRIVVEDSVFPGGTRAVEKRMIAGGWSFDLPNKES